MLLAVAIILLGSAGTLMAEAVLLEIPVGTYPKYIGVNPETNTIYAANYMSDNVSVIDGESFTVETLDIPGGPNALEIDVARNKVYVATGNSNTLTVIDGSINGVTASIALSGMPYDIDLNPATNKIYAVSRSADRLYTIDGVTHSVSEVAVGRDPLAVRVNPVTNKIYVANQQGDSLSVVDGETNTVTTIPVGEAPRYLCINTVTNKIYVSNYYGISVSVVDGASDSVTATIPVVSNPDEIEVNETTNKLYAIHWAPGNMSVIDGSTDTLIENVMLKGCPEGLAINTLTNKVYVASVNSAYLSIIDGVTHDVHTLLCGYGPYAVAIDMTRNISYTANFSDNSVSVIGVPVPPTVSSLGPDSKNAGGPSFYLTVNGTGFLTSSVVRWKGSNRTTSYVSPKQLVATISAADIASPGTAEVTVYTPEPEAGLSNPVTFTIRNTIPVTVASITPASGANTGVIAARITGSGFQADASVRLQRDTTVINATGVVVESDTSITCNLDLTSKPLGRYDVYVKNAVGQEGTLAGGFGVTDICGQGAAASVMVVAGLLGLISLAGAGRSRFKR